ncbi:MAG: hypothetical protein M3O35_06585 [Acidobacteriota bacterium]|nr:hypothetical protein [Acidobacteriota bacterium]
MGCEITAGQSSLLGARLDAAYCYQKQTFRTVFTDSKYNVANHDGDWVDNQQLFYLCDPGMHLLTDDDGIVKKSASSTQCKRVLPLKTFV